MSDDCLFCRIAAGTIPVGRVYEDDWCIAFRDIRPHAPHHLVVIPREHVPTALDLDPVIAGRLLIACAAAARAVGVAEGGFRIVINAGADGGQEVLHVHAHVLGGRLLGWPPG